MNIKEVTEKLQNVTEIQKKIRIEHKPGDPPPTPEDLENIPLQTVGYRANCPAHPDTSRSLVVNKVRNCTDLSFHCSRGCTYGKIMEALRLMDEEMVS